MKKKTMPTDQLLPASFTDEKGDLTEEETERGGGGGINNM